MSCKKDQAVVLMLHKMAFQFSDKVVALHLDKILLNHGSTASLFLSILACHILNPADKHSITLIPAYIHTHHTVGTILWGRLVPEWHMLPHIG